MTNRARSPEHRVRPAPPQPDFDFATAVVDWQRRHGRHDLPWQNTRDAYRIWLSEIMLQQTQVSAVLSYYERFLARFPDLASLAAAPVDDVMALWSGLGYYSRARNLHACAQRVMTEHGGRFPCDPAVLAELPGIGRSTAAAIAAFAYGARAAILDGNVKRVFARFFGIEAWTGEPKIERGLWERADTLLPRSGNGDIEAYTQGLMDLGATICTRGHPRCGDCPLAARCVARAIDATARLPVARPRKLVPVRSAHVLVAMRAGEVMVEKRPPTGIWGGLWSLPQFDDVAALIAHAQALDASAVSRLTERTHSFTHFTLRFTPHLANIGAHVNRVESPGRIWLPLSDVRGAALPAPIKTLLLEFGRAFPPSIE